MARIDYSSVSISLRQFEDVASGKYNAGEVKLTDQHTLDKVNNHIHFTCFNNTSIPHAEVVAIKNAFVKALSEGGVNAEEIGKIRVQLGLDASSRADAKFDERSMKPLSRQQIRDILDQYAGVLNVRTYGERKANVPQATRQAQAETRQNVNNSLDANRETEPNEAIVMFQKVLASDVDFAEGKDYNNMLREAKRQLEALYAGCGDNPSTEKQAKARCELPGGQSVEIDTGMSEAAYAERLFQTIARLEYMDLSRHRRLDYRSAYQNLDHADRIGWIANLTHEPPDALVMARTAAVVALQEKGINDFEALSLVNKITFASVVDLLVNLEDPEHHENWQMTRDNVFNIMRQYPTHEDGNSGCVYIPATSPSQYNRALRTFFKDVSANNTPPAPPGFKTFALGLMSEMRARFGEDVVPEGDKLDRFIDGNKLKHFVQVEGDGDYAANAARARLDDLRGEFAGMVRKMGARRAVLLFATNVAKGMNVELKNETILVNAITSRNKNLLDSLAACEDHDRVSELLESVRADTEKSVRRCAILDRYRIGDGFRALVREELSAMTGIPPATLKGKALADGRLRILAARLSDKINSGEIQADTEDEIRSKLLEEAHKFAQERKVLLDKVDSLEVTDAVKSEMKTWILSEDKVSFVDFDDILGKMEEVNDKAWRLSEELKGFRQKGDKATPADKDAVYLAMKKLAQEVDELVEAQFKAKGIDAEYPEKTTLGTLVTTLAVGRFVGIREDIAYFMSRFDVSAEMGANRENLEHLSNWGFRFTSYAAPNVAEANAGIRDEIASGRPDAMTGQAIYQGCRDAGLTAVKPEEAVELFKAGRILSRELTDAIDGLPAVATPQMIRTIVSAVVGRHATQIENGRPKPVLLATPAERKAAIVNRIAGGNGAAAQKTRQILEAKLGPDPQDPESKTIGEMVRNVRVLLLKGVLRDLKTIAGGKKGMYLDVDFNRVAVNLAGIGNIQPGNADEAANYFARFVTGKADATYASLSKKDKARADFAMAMAAQSSQNSLLTGFAVMMDPDGRILNFAPSGSSDPGVWKTAMEIGKDGELKVSITAEMKPKAVAYNGGNAEMCNPGSTFKMSADFTFTASELNRIADVDFSKYNGTALDNRIDVEKPKNMCEGAIDLIQMDYRINAKIDVDVEGDFK